MRLARPVRPEPTGATGATGATGPTGATGATGSTGPSATLIGGSQKDIKDDETRFIGMWVVEPVNASDDETEMQQVVATPGTVSQFYILLNDAAGETDAGYTFTLRLNGDDTDVTCEATEAETDCSDLVNDAHFDAGDLISISAVPIDPAGGNDPTNNLDVQSKCTSAVCKIFKARLRWCSTPFLFLRSTGHNQTIVC